MNPDSETPSMTDLGALRRANGKRAASAERIPSPPPRWKTRILVPAAILLLVMLLLAWSASESILPATPVRVVPVVVKAVHGSSGSVTVQAPGWLEPDPHPHYVSALDEGTVEEILVLEGDSVERGEVVARLVDEDARLSLRRAEAELQRERASVLAAQADLTAARDELSNLIEPARAAAVAKAMVSETEAEIVQLASDVAAARARLLEIQDEYERKSGLTESHAVSEATVARLKLQLEAQQAAVAAIEARGGVLRSRLDAATADALAAGRDLQLLIQEKRAVALAEAAVASAEAAIALAEVTRDEAALRLERMEVRSPVAGVVMRRLATPGSKLMRDGMEHSMHVVHVYDPMHLQVRVDVPLADASHITIGQPAEITVEVLPDRVFTGRVTRIVHEADIQKNTVEVKVAIDEPTSDLKPEMLARARFLAVESESDGAATTRQRIFAPQELIRAGEAGSSEVLVASSLTEGRGRAERRSVTAGRTRMDGWIEIDAGLQPGDLLIAEAPPDLAVGDRIRVVGEGRGGE